MRLEEKNPTITVPHALPDNILGVEELDQPQDDEPEDGDVQDDEDVDVEDGPDVFEDVDVPDVVEDMTSATKREGEGGGGGGEREKEGDVLAER